MQLRIASQQPRRLAKHARHGLRFAPAAALFLGGLFLAPASAQEPDAVVEMTAGLRFEPDPVEITVGDTIEWRNTSGVQHTVTADEAQANDPSYVSLPDGAEPFDSGLIGAGGTFTRTFTVAGSYEYFCIPHQDAGMRGTIVVRADGEDGEDREDGADARLEDPIPEEIPSAGVQIQLEPVLEGIVAPNWGTSAPGLPGRLFVVDQPGQVHTIDLATGESSIFIDVADRLVELGIAGPDSFDERGLLGLAFHPDYQSNGLLYTYTSEPATAEPDFSTLPEDAEPDHQSVVTEWRVNTPDDPNATPDPDSAREVLRIDQPQFNHDAGAMIFDADRLLLIALGDGGGADDQGEGHGEDGNGQDRSNPLGALIRIDPLERDSANEQYGVPSTNPFFGQAGVTDEIYAYGLRNPFRISYDAQTNEIWAADAGQNDIEEVNRIAAGGNYGWNIKEGSFFFDPNGEDDGFVTDEPAEEEVPADLIDPVAEYDHDEGIAVVGGFVYRGTDVPALSGRYVFGDYGTAASGGRLFVLDEEERIGELDVAADEGFDLRVLGFGRDADGELYVLVNETGTPFGETGAVLRLSAVPGSVAFERPELSISEGDGEIEVTVARTAGANGTASIDVEVTGGSASEGEDYELSDGTLSWIDGEDGPKTFTIDIVDDSDEEPVETIELSLVDPAGVSLGDPAELTVSIQDDDEAASGGGGSGAAGWGVGAVLLAILLLIGRGGPRRRGRRRSPAPDAAP